VEQVEYLNSETRALLTLMKFRVVGVLHFELWTNPLTVSEYRTLLENERDDQVFADQAARLFVRQISLAARIAPRLLPELLSILWAHVLDRLVEESICKLNGFGEFRINRAVGTVHVEFTPSSALVESGIPPLLHSTLHIENMIHELCHQAVATAREDVASDYGPIPGWHLPLIGTALIESALGVACVNALNSQEVRHNDELAVLAMSASAVAYYAWLAAFAFELGTRSEFNMPDVGLFKGRNSHVEFTPVPSFSALLVANLPPLVKGLAA
jgi:hypothetical protein